MAVTEGVLVVLPAQDIVAFFQIGQAECLLRPCGACFGLRFHPGILGEIPEGDRSDSAGSEHFRQALQQGASRFGRGDVVHESEADRDIGGGKARQAGSASALQPRRQVGLQEFAGAGHGRAGEGAAVVHGGEG